jgi:hypothetical protein
MKTMIFFMILSLGFGMRIGWAQAAAAPHLVYPPPPVAQTPPTSPGKEMYDFGWPDWFANLPHDTKMQVNPEGSELGLDYWGETPTDLEVQRVEVDVLSQLETNQFAIEGRMYYEKVAPGSYLEMWCYFEPEKKGDPQTAYVTRTLADSGLTGKLGGDSKPGVGGDGRFQLFQIPFDMTGAKTHIERVIFKIHFAGGYGTTFQFDSVRFVQYPNGYFPSSVASVSTLSPVPIPPPSKTAAGSGSSSGKTMPQSSGIDWKSFWLGVAATGVFLLAGGGIIFISRRWQRRRHERELRRIASMDG